MSTTAELAKSQAQIRSCHAVDGGAMKLAGIGLLLFIIMALIVSHIAERDAQEMQDKLNNWRPK